MEKYYFFKISTERNDSGQMRKVAHPIPGQTTYVTRNERARPLDPALKVQFELHENSKAVRLPDGVVIGVCHRAERECDTALSIRSRNGVFYYRTEAKLFLVDTTDPDLGSSFFSDIIGAADQAMTDAYSRILSAQHRADATASDVSAISSSQQETNANADALSPYVQKRTDMTKLDAIEQSLSQEFGRDECLRKLLMLSQLRDRMRHGVAKFSFIKTNGDTRIAYGTLNPEVIAMFAQQTDNQPYCQIGSPTDNADGDHIAYFDVQSVGWRSFCTERISTLDRSALFTDKAVIRTISAA